MSVNLNLSLKVTGYRADRVMAINEAVAALLAREELSTDMSALTECSEDGRPTLVSHSDRDFPVIISKSYEWLPEMQAAFEAAVVEANGASCAVEFSGDYPDNSDEDEEEETEEEE